MKWSARRRARWRRRNPEGASPPWCAPWGVGPEVVEMLRAVGFTWAQARAARSKYFTVLVHDGRVTRWITRMALTHAFHARLQLRNTRRP